MKNGAQDNGRRYIYIFLLNICCECFFWFVENGSPLKIAEEKKRVSCSQEKKHTHI